MRESPLSHRAAEESLPFREAFSVLFFVSVGMLFDPSMLLQEPLKVLMVVAIIVVGKTLAAFFIVLLFRYPLNTALTVSASLAQIGEFSFILVGLGVSLNVLPEQGQSLILAGALISIALNPLIFSVIDPIQTWIRSRQKPQPIITADDPLSELPTSVDLNRLTGHVLIVGYGRVGRRIGEALMLRNIPIVVAEQNRQVVETLREHNIPAVSGDATEPNVLIQAHVARAQMLVIASPDTFRARKMIETARILNANIQIIIRAHSDEEADLLRKEKLGEVFMGEHELAMGMTDYVLKHIMPTTAH